MATQPESNIAIATSNTLEIGDIGEVSDVRCIGIGEIETSKIIGGPLLLHLLRCSRLS